MTQQDQKSAAKKFIADWAGKGYEKGESQKFWLDLLCNVFGVQDFASFISFEDQVKLDHTSFIDGYIPSTKVLIEQKSIDKDLRAPIKQSDGTFLNPFQQAKRYITELPVSRHPRWVVTSNFKSFLVYDMENPNGEPEEILLENLEKEYYRLSFITDTASVHLQKELEISKKAGDIIGEIYDAILAQYKDAQKPSPATLKSLNMLCVRIVFCLYAEDAGIFGHKAMFGDYLKQFEPKDLRRALLDLFAVLDQKEEERDEYLEDSLAAFPYVNGGLFTEEDRTIPPLTQEIKDLLVRHASSEFDWSEISPTIFGAIFESTLNPETRRSGGMHYTSIENIHKVIDPLFLDDLKAEFESLKAVKNAKAREEKTIAFQKKLGSLRFLDPACGSGNFLTETYLSLRKLENECLKLRFDQAVLDVFTDTVFVKIHQFYGIEINDFAAVVAKTALWIAESQMMKETSTILGRNLAFLPLKSYANIVEGNALRINWEKVGEASPTLQPPTAFSATPSAGDTPATPPIFDYIMGNPPFVGARLMTESQKEDVFSIFGNTKNAGNLDYVSCWYKKAADLIQGTNIHAALVSTNSITQGEQVAILWKTLAEQGIKIDFAYRTFRWDSEANLKAHVHCVIVGFSGIANGSVALTGRANGSFAHTNMSANTVAPYIHNRGYLPHIENKQLQFITYRLYDSVPAEKIIQWKEELHILENIDSNDPKMQELRSKISKYEDAGYGQCFLKNDKIAKIVQDNLLHFNDERYILHNWCIMPNHVHVLIEVKSGFTLSEILHGWKSYTAKEANKILGRTGTFWQEEYFDRYIRNEEHYKNVMEYIDNNPVKAGFVKKAEEWKWGKSAFDIESCRRANSSGTANGSFANTVSSNTSPSITSVVVDSSNRADTFQGSRADCSPTKKIFLNDSQFIEAKNINGYLLDAPDIFIESRAKPLCDIPEIGIGNKPIDGGNYLFTEEEKTAFIKKEPQSEKYFKKWLGADEFINRYYRYCLWLGDCSPSEIKKMPESFRRVQAVREFRLASTSRPTQKLADTPTRFHVENFPKSTYLLVPRVSSEKRRYIPIGFITPDIISSDSVHIIPDATLYHFGVLTSNVHMAWMRAVAGRLKSDYRYSKDIVYNNFPFVLPKKESHADSILLTQNQDKNGKSLDFPNPCDNFLICTAEQAAKIEQTAQGILDARAKYPDSSLADLYNETLMPPELRRAHQANDRAVMQAYGFSTKMSESECVAELFRMYEKLANGGK